MNFLETLDGYIEASLSDGYDYTHTLENGVSRYKFETHDGIVLALGEVIGYIQSWGVNSIKFSVVINDDLESPEYKLDIENVEKTI